MSRIKQVLRLHLEDMSNRSIARQLGLYKGTVNEYIHKLKRNDFDIGELLKLEDPELEKKFSAGIRLIPTIKGEARLFRERYFP